MHPRLRLLRTGTSPPPIQSASSAVLIARPDPLSLGSVKPGESARGTLTVRNPRAEAVTIERIETSCPCLRVAPWPLRVNAGESAKLDVVSIEDDTPDFQGTLTIDITGFGADGAEVLRTMVRLEFLPGESDRRAPK